MNISRYAIKSDHGPVLGNNEDGHLIMLEKGLFLVFDGFGGLGIGDKAVTFLKEKIAHFFEHFSGGQDSTMPFFFSPKYLIEANALINSLLLSNNELFKQNQALPLNQRGGASVGGIIFSSHIITFIGVGSVRGYLIRQGKIFRLMMGQTLDNCMNKDLETKVGPVPQNVMGMYADLQFISSELRFSKGDKILLLSDGVYSNLIDQELLQIADYSQGPLMNKIDNLFGQANARGNQDNQTTLLIEV